MRFSKSSMGNRKLALIPSAKLVPVELQNEFGPISTGMIPIDSRPAIDYISTYFSKFGFSILVAYHEESSDLLSFCDKWQQSSITAVDVGDTNSLGESVLNALSIINLDDVDQLVINFADTIIDESIPESDTIFYAEVDDTFRWTSFTITEDGRISSVTDKYYAQPELNSLSNVFIGVFSFLKPKRLQSLLEQSIRDESSLNIDPFYLALQHYFNELSKEERCYQLVFNWFDFGHIDTYYRTKKRINIGAREFNSVDLDNKRGIILKSSKHGKKFEDEINWYLKIPNELKYMTPRVLDYYLCDSDSYLKLEYYGYPALNDAYLFANYDLGTWNHIFSAIEFLMREMQSFNSAPLKKEAIQDSLKMMYIDKTIDRVNQYLTDPNFSAFRKDALNINGQECLGLDSFYETFTRVVESLGLLESDQFSVIHGDLCLSNLLYDRRNQIIRIIDPRGSFGEFDIYGDPRYDAAKLSHSLSGDYDFLANGLFDFQWLDSESIHLSPWLKEKHIAIKGLYKTRFKDFKNQIRLVESLLFISMVPLHSDRPISQHAFLARGLELFSYVLKNSTRLN